MTDEETLHRVGGCRGRGQCGCSQEVFEWTLPSEEGQELVPTGRTFEGGAYRDSEEGKLDYEGFFSPAVLKARAEYMHKHRTQSNGEVRDSDNWQAGMPMDVYMKSAWRHFVDWWTRHRDDVLYEDDPAALQEAICALMFNCEGYLHELLKEA